MLLLNSPTNFLSHHSNKIQNLKRKALSVIYVGALALTSFMPGNVWASLCDITFTGTVTAGTDYSGVFLTPGATFSNQPFTLVYTFDDTQGTQTTFYTSGQPVSSQIINNATSNPGTAKLTIGSKTFNFGVLSTTLPTSAAIRNTALNTTYHDDVRNNFSESYGGSNGAQSGSSTIYAELGSLIANPMPGMSYNWETMLPMYTFQTNDYQMGNFQINYDVGACGSCYTQPSQNASGTLTITSVKVSGPYAGSSQVPPAAANNSSKGLGLCPTCPVASSNVPENTPAPQVNASATPTNNSTVSQTTGGSKSGALTTKNPKIQLASIEPNAINGNPINAATGNKVQPETDFVLAPNTQLSLTRVYNSYDSTVTPFGYGWHSNWHRSVSASGSTAKITREDGKVETFTLSGSTWTSDADVTSTLSTVTSGGVQTGWKMVRPDDSTELYNLAGQLTSVTTRAGLITTLAYDTSNRLSTVTGPFGHKLTFAYNSNNNISTITIPDNGVYTYTYNYRNNLISVKYPDGKSRTYVYENPAYPHLLTGIFDELNVRYATYTYDSQGRATSSQHANGVDLTTIAYNTDGTVTATDALSNAHTYAFITQFSLIKPATLTGTPYPAAGGQAFTYDANGFIASRTDFNGNITNYVHDARGNETSRIEAYGTSLARTITTTWHATFHLPLTVTEPNRVTTYTYDTNGNMLTKTIAANSKTRVWTYTYNTSGQLLTIDGPRTDVTDVTTFTYDTKGDVATIKDALGHITSITSYDADGRPLSVTDPNGLVTAFTYDARGRLLTSKPGTLTTTFAYDAAGNLLTVTHPDYSVLTYTYDAAHRLIGVKDTAGDSIAYTLNNVGQRTLVQVYDPSKTLKKTQSYTYDAVNRLYQVIGALNQTTTYTYDANSNLKTVTDPLTHANTYTYDALNRLATVLDPNNGTTTNGYDANDHLTSVTDPRTLVTSYSPDGLDNLNSQTSPDTGLTSYTYDAAGNILTATDARSKTTTYAYDALNRLTSATYSDGTTATYTYDAGTYGIGHLTSMVDVAGTTTWTYDKYGSVLTKAQKTGTLTLTTTYTYDSYERLSTITYPSTKSITYTYDGSGRISGINNTVSISSVTYFPFGPMSGWTEPNGAVYTRAFDTDGRLTTVSIGTSNVQTLTYDNANRITRLTETGLAGKTYGYDTLDRLTALTIGTAVTNYAYDVNSNRTSTITTAGTTTYNYPTSSNKLSGRTGLVTETESYDASGHQTGDGTRTYTYDARGRMTQATVGGVNTNYGLNGFGQRIVKSGTGVTPGGSNEYVYDEAGHLIGEYDASGNVIEETVWLGNSPVAVMTTVGTTRYVYSVSPDWLNAPHIIANSTKVNVWTWDHVAYGDSTPNQNPSGLGVFGYNLRFPGQYADSETGLDYNSNRDYNPNLGRYIQSDPIGLRGGDYSTYAYVGGNPLTRTDPKGLLFNPLELGCALGPNPVCVIGVVADGLTWAGVALAAYGTAELAENLPPSLQNSPLYYGTTKEGDKFYHYSYCKYADSLAGGLRPGSFATPLDNLTGLQAQQGLSLPGAVPPDSVYTVTPPPGTPYFYNPSAAPLNGQPGQYPEVNFPYGTPPGSVSGPRPIPSGVPGG